MRLTNLQAELLGKLAENWNNSPTAPAPIKNFRLESLDEQTSYPLFPELENLSAGEPCSLPFFVAKGIHWVLLASEQRRLLEGISRLRSWIMPSFGWEDERPFVGPLDSPPGLGSMLLKVSPPGYFRWRSREAHFFTVTRKLAQIRALNRAKPDIAFDLVPSLLELRQHFRLALVMGDRNGAETVVKTIDRFALDTAPNTAFMRIRLKTAFGDYPGIVSSPDLKNIIALRMPQSVQSSIIAAFYAERLESYAARSDWKGMLKSYRDSVHVEIGDLIRGADPKQDLSVQRSIACCAVVENDPVRVGMLLQVSNDPVVTALVSEVASHLTTTSGLLIFFDTAWRRQDWAAVQYAGALLLKAEPCLDAETRSTVLHVLRRSLLDFPNDAIEHLIRDSVATATESRTVPQNWQEFSEAVRTGQLDAAYRFLVLDVRPALEMSSLTQIDTLQTTFEEVLTDPALHSYRGVDIAEVAASAIIEDLIRRPRYPEHEFRELYLTLFQFWVQNHQKSGRVEDEAVFLTLASGLLNIDVHSSVTILAAAGSWWRTRRNRTRLRFLLEILDLVLAVDPDTAGCEELWADGLALAGKFWKELSGSERSLWKSLGERLGHPRGFIEKSLGISSSEAKPEHDLIAQSNLNKIAIVSLNENAARQAAEIIRQHTKATILVVNDKTASASTDSAKNADVILFVWTATKHAVYRAFDSVRDKIEYVSGGGASSIILALERRLARQGKLAAADD